MRKCLSDITSSRSKAKALSREHEDRRIGSTPLLNTIFHSHDYIMTTSYFMLFKLSKS
jgi:hypothetical protein